LVPAATARALASGIERRRDRDHSSDQAAIPPHERAPGVGRAVVRDPSVAHCDHYGCRINAKEIEMNWDQVEGNWKQLKGNVKEQWGKLTDDQLDVIAGKRDQLAGKIQEAYGVSKEEAEKQLSDWEKRQR
jgi:uncharacterized protein YjbJ (UPF0337 family)